MWAFLNACHLEPSILIMQREIQTYRGGCRCTMNHLQSIKIDWFGFVVSTSWPPGVVSCFTFRNLLLLSVCFHDFILPMTCDVLGPCCAFRFTMYVYMYPYQICIEFCAEFSSSSSQVKLTSSMELAETELKSRVGSLGYVHAQGQLLNPVASLQHLPYYFSFRNNTLG